MALSVKVETVSPKVAMDLLENNNKNRYLSQYMVDQYAEAMKADEWQENGETIKLTDKDELIDGQHRLHAIIQSKTSQKLLIVRGLHQDNIQTIDIGKKRTNADSLEMAGYKNKLLLSAAINVCLSFQGGEYKEKKRRKTPTMAMNYIKRNPRLSNSVNRYANSGGDKKVTTLVPISLLAALHHQLSGADKGAADLFIHDFLNPDGFKKGDPIHTLREKLSLEAHNIHQQRGSLYRRKLISYFVTAFNATVDGEKLTALNYDPSAPIKIEKAK